MKIVMRFVSSLISLLLILFLSISVFSCAVGDDDDDDKDDSDVEDPDNDDDNNDDNDNDDGEQDFAYDACAVVSGTTRQVFAKVLNAERCNIGSSPIVMIRLSFPFDPIGLEAGICTGTAITEDTILTAGHCFRETVPSMIITGQGEVAVRDWTVHPGYFEDEQAQVVFNDVAFVFTVSPVDVRTFPILLSRDAFVGEEGVVTGYGIDESEQYGTFRAGNTIVSNMSTAHIFARYDGTGSNPCQGDSGGPILLAYRSDGFAVAGVVSTGTRTDCQPGDTTLFTNLANNSVADWILSLVPDAEIR